MNRDSLISKAANRNSVVITVALSLLTLLAARAEAQQGPTESWRLNAYGTLRAGGSWRGEASGYDFSQDMDVGGGLGVRLEIPLHPVQEFVVLGPMLEYQVMKPSGIVGYWVESIHALNFGLWAKGRYVLDLAGNPLELYVGMPIGLALYFSDAIGFETELGVNVGLMLGAQMFLGNRVGLLFEAGFRRDGFRRQEDLAIVDVTVRLRAIQFVMNAGISITL